MKEGLKEGLTNLPQILGFTNFTNYSYTFWIGASLGILGARELVDVDAIKTFLARAHHDNIGGYGKFEGCVPDLLHSYMSLAGLDLLTVEGGIVCELNVRKIHIDKMLKARDAV
jgi:hypothetical protein